MKKINNNLLLGIMIGGILFGCIGVGATLVHQSEQISYNNDKNVKEALDELYSKIKKYDTEYKELNNSVSIPVTTGTGAHLYILNNTVRLVVSGNASVNVALNSYTYIGKITDPKYYPLTVTTCKGEGASVGSLTIKVDTNGNIYAAQSIQAHSWISINMVWIIAS